MNRKFSDEELDEICRDRLEGDSYPVLANRYGCTHSTLARLFQRRGIHVGKRVPHHRSQGMLCEAVTDDSPYGLYIQYLLR